MKVGDRVKIAKNSRYYRCDDPNNPHCSGEVFNVGIGYDLNISVRWDNGNRNSYNDHDLEFTNN